MTGHTGIITACAHEAALVRRRLHSRWQGTSTAGRVWQGVIHNQSVVLLQCGMGPERAAQAVLWLHQHYQLAGVLSVGFAGGLQAGLAPGDALLATNICALSDTPGAMSSTVEEDLRPDARLAHIAAMAVAQAVMVSHAGTLLSTTAMVAQAAAKQDMGRRSGALAVDMESYSIGHVATQSHLPFAVLRTIFDTANETFAPTSDRLYNSYGLYAASAALRLSGMPALAVGTAPALGVGLARGGAASTTLVATFLPSPEPRGMTPRLRLK